MEESAAKEIVQKTLIDNLKKSNENLKDTLTKMNHKAANNQIKYLELMVKFEGLTKSIEESL